MIVKLHIRLSVRHKTIDPDFPIKVMPHPANDRCYLVRGNQLLLAGMRTNAAYFKLDPNRWYAIRKSDTVPCYIKPTQLWKEWHKDLDMDYVFQVKGWYRELPLLSVKEVIKATGSVEAVAYAIGNNRDLVPINDGAYVPC